MVGLLATPVRFERTTFSSAGKRSNPLSYGVVFRLPVHYSIVWLMMQMPAEGFPSMPEPVLRAANDAFH